MYDYESKEEVTSSPPMAATKSITTKIDIIFTPNPRPDVSDVNKMNNTLLLTNTQSVNEEMKSNDTNYHACGSPTELPSASSSSLFSSEEEESIETPIISNRPMQRDAPPLLCLPPTLSSLHRTNLENCTSKITTNHLSPATAKCVHITTLKKKSPRFSSYNDAPIIMTSTALDGWRKKRSSTTTTRDQDTILSERLPAIVELVQFSTCSDYGTSPATLASDIIRCSIESIARMGLFLTLNRIKRTLFESSSASLLQHRQCMDNHIHKYNVPVSVSPSIEYRQQKNKNTKIAARSTDVCPDARNELHCTSGSTLNESTKLPKPKYSTTTILPKTTIAAPISRAVVKGICSNKRVVGIRNYGQTCFLNSVIQALASLDPFVAYLERGIQINLNSRKHLQMTSTDSYLPDLGRLDDSYNDKESIDSYVGRIFQLKNKFMTQSSTLRPGDNHKNSFFCEEMLNLLQSVNGEKQEVSGRQCIDPRPILLAVGRKHKQFQRRYGGVGVAAVGEQQDAQELLQAVLGMIIDECQFDLTPLAVPSSIVSSFAQNDSYGDIDADADGDSSLEEESVLLHSNIAMHSISKAMEIMMTTTSSISPCPLSVWCGSALMCSNCHRVRPIQNIPFLDIPIIPTSISHQMMHAPLKGQNVPSCRLEDCLKEFTSIERVLDVECKNCTIQAEIQEKVSDREFQLQIIDGIRSRRSKTHAKSSGYGDCSRNSQTNDVLDDLIAIEKQIEFLSRLSPDDDSPLYKGTTANGTTIIIGPEETATTPTKIPLKRCDAFKCLLLTRLPSILSIHVQRRYFDPNTGKSSKTMQHISFPEMLDVSSFCAYGASQKSHASFAGTINIKQSNAQSSAATSMPIWYKLMAVIEHRGGPYSGHYVCYRRDPSALLEDRWLWISDDTVRVCHWCNVKNCQAYMLFYEAT
jgi:ubiquitin C-terminal hydrolase